MSDVKDPEGRITRSVTEEEIQFYRENGWAHLKGLIPLAKIQEILSELEEMAAKLPTHSADYHSGLLAMFESMSNPSRENAFLRSFSHDRALGDVAASLQGSAVKFWRDECVRKMPSSHAASAKTPWHQDQPYTPADRSGRLQIWIALVDIPPERGSLRFLTGSHRSGLLGRAFEDQSPAMEARIDKALAEYPISPPLHLKAGDATLHDGLTIHGAPANSTDAARWGYVVQYIVADAQYNGAPGATTDGCPGLEFGKTFPDVWFPTVGWPKDAN